MLTAMGDFASQDLYTASINLIDILGVEMIIIMSLQVRDREGKPFSQLLNGRVWIQVSILPLETLGGTYSVKNFSLLSCPQPQVDYEHPFTGRWRSTNQGKDYSLKPVFALGCAFPKI